MFTYLSFYLSIYLSIYLSFYLSIHIYIYIYICSHENNVMYGSSCAQVNELPQSHCGDNREGTYIVFMITYILHPSCFSEI